jgi:hypothetical protein
VRLHWGRVTLALMMPAGVLAGHALGYGVAGPHAGHDHHGYLPAAGAAAAVLALAALFAAAAGPGRGHIRLSHLVAAQAAAFATQEVIEHAAAGHGAAAVLESPAVWLGLAAQVATALCAALVVASASAAGAVLLAARPADAARALPAPTWLPPAADPFPAGVVLLAAGPRGPPGA